ncbi:MAG: MFS transporter [Acidobacteriota bacterium]
MPTPREVPAVRPREIVSWAMFDFANSSYTTVIVTVAYSVIFSKLIAPAGKGDALWGTAIALANLFVLLLSPIIGAVADDSGRKKPFLFVTYATCVLFTASLWFVTPGHAVLGLVLFVLSFVGFSFGENLTAAFLPEISRPDNIGKISGLGWGLGYFGGLGSLVLVWPLLKGDFVLPNLENLRLVGVATAAFFLVAAVPTFVFLKERAPRGSASLGTYVRAGFGRLGQTAHSIRRFSELGRFLTVFFVYSCGLSSVFAFAGIYAERTIGFTSKELIVLFILLQLSAAGGAFTFGFIQDRLGAVNTIRITLVLWVLVCIGVYLCGDGGSLFFGRWTGKQMFWGVSMFSGIGIGSLQSASRGLVGLFSPAEKSGEFFGFWGLSGKAAYMVGPFVFGLISTATNSQRIAMLSTGGFFLAGLLAMPLISEKRGRAAVAAWHAEKETAHAAQA